jgi:hypothetical protein
MLSKNSMYVSPDLYENHRLSVNIDFQIVKNTYLLVKCTILIPLCKASKWKLLTENFPVVWKMFKNN